LTDRKPRLTLPLPSIEVKMTRNISGKTKVKKARAGFSRTTC
jgi:hypothetical protein